MKDQHNPQVIRDEMRNKELCKQTKQIRKISGQEHQDGSAENLDRLCYYKDTMVFIKSNTKSVLLIEHNYTDQADIFFSVHH